MMSRIFISYRRSDSISESGRIHDHLEREFGGRNVFKDVDDIAPGLDFRKVLDDEVAQCDVLLAIIGPSWSSASDADGNPRLQNADDFVRIEVESGLKRGDEVLVIPVLVNDADMPKLIDLPESLHDLTYRNAVIVRNDPDFNRDMRRLIDYINRYRKQNRPNRLPMMIGSVVLALVVIVAILLVVTPPGGPVPAIMSTEDAQVIQSTATDLPDSPEPGDSSTAKSLTDEAQDLASNGNYAEAIDKYTEAIASDTTSADAYFGRALAHVSGFGDASTAIDDLEQAIALNPNYAEAYRYLGLYHSYEENYGDIEPNLVRAIELNPNDTEARRILAEYFLSVGRYFEASEQYQAILEKSDSLDPDKIYDAQFGLAYSAEGLGNSDSALDLYQDAIDSNPDRYEAYARIGNVYVYQQEYEQALSFLDSAIDRNDEDPDVYVNRGNVHLALENYTEAKADFDRALVLQPSNVTALVGRGRVAINVGENEEAVADFSQAISGEPDFGSAYYWRGFAHHDEDRFELAIDDLTQAIDLDSFAGEAYAYRGFSYIQLAEFSMAIDDLETALDYGLSQPLQYDVLVELGWSSLVEGNADGSLDYFTQAIAVDPVRSFAYEGQISNLIFQAENTEDENEEINLLLTALTSADRAIEQIDDNPLLYTKRGEINKWLGELNDDNEQLETAIVDFEMAISLDSEYVTPYVELADLMLYNDGYDLNVALENAETAYELDDGNPDVTSILGEAHEALANVDEAKRFYQLTIDNSTDDEQREEYQSRLDALSDD